MTFIYDIFHHHEVSKSATYKIFCDIYMKGPEKSHSAYVNSSPINNEIMTITSVTERRPDQFDRGQNNIPCCQNLDIPVHCNA